MFERVAAVGGVVAAGVLMNPLMVGPVPGRHDRVARVLLAVPARDPDVVGLDERRSLGVRKVADPGISRAVDAGLVPEGMQLLCPRREELEHGGVRREPCRIALHVVVDRVPGRDPECAGLRHRVAGGGRSLRRRALGLIVRAAAARAAGLKADVRGDQVPPRCGLLAHPSGAQVGLGAGDVGAADVDADRVVGRRRPCRHRRRARRRAGVEPESRVCPGGRGSCPRNVGAAEALTESPRSAPSERSPRARSIISGSFAHVPRTTTRCSGTAISAAARWAPGRIDGSVPGTRDVPLAMVQRGSPRCGQPPREDTVAGRSVLPDRRRAG